MRKEKVIKRIGRGETKGGGMDGMEKRGREKEGGDVEREREGGGGQKTA